MTHQNAAGLPKSGDIGMSRNPFDASRSFFLLDDSLEIDYKSLEEIKSVLQNLVPQCQDSTISEQLPQQHSLQGSQVK